MHDMEAFTEAAVRATADSGLPIQEKRSLIHSLFILESQGDTGFTNARTLKQMVECRYTFLFDKEQMWDYEANRRFYDIDLPRKVSFGHGSVYPYRNFGGDFPEADGKLCVDSGSPAWKAMVEAGKITGEGAAPPEQLGGLETLQKAKYLITRQNGFMDSRVRQGLVSTFFLTDAGGEVDENTPIEPICELLGITRAQYESKDFGALDEQAPQPAYPSPARVYYFLGRTVPFSLDEGRWEDGSWLFYGYKSAEPFFISLWGRERVPCELRFLSQGAPLRVNPFAVGSEQAAWLARAREIASDITAFQREIDDMIAPAFARDASPVLKQCLNWDKMRAWLASLKKLNTDTSSSLDEALASMEKIFFSMANILENARIPDSVLSERNPCTALFSKLKVTVHGYMELGNRPLMQKLAGPRFMPALLRFNSLLESMLVRHKLINLNRSERGTPDEIELVSIWKSELEELELNPERENNGRRAELMDNLWRSDVLFLDERGIYAAKLSSFYTQAVQTLEEHKQKHREAVAKIPDLSGSIRIMEEQLGQLSAISLEQAINAAGSSLPLPGAAPVAAEIYVRLGEDSNQPVQAAILLGAPEWEHSLLTRWEGQSLLEAARVERLYS